MAPTLTKKILIGFLSLIIIGFCVFYWLDIIDLTTFVASILGCLLFIVLNVMQVKKESKKLFAKLIAESEKLFEKNELKGAMAIYERILKAKPDYYDAVIGMGRSCEGLREFEKSEEVLKKAIELQPKGYRGHLFLGSTYFHAGKMLEARDSMKRAHDLKPDASLVYYYLGHIHEVFKDNNDAIENYKKYLELKPDSTHKGEVKEKIKKLQTS